MPPVELHGDCDPRFAPLRDAFARNWSDHAEVGASLCVVERGQIVVDLWAGWADAAHTRPWQQDTIANVYSTTKGVAAVAAAILADRGALDVAPPSPTTGPNSPRPAKTKSPSTNSSPTKPASSASTKNCPMAQSSTGTA